MDDLLFGIKRAHLAGNRWAREVLARFGVTPARFDLMHMLYARRDFSMAQSFLRSRLGVARATLSRMLRSLEELGWIERRVDPFDRRTRSVTLSYKARSIVWTVLDAIIRTRVVADRVDAALKLQIHADVAAERGSAEWLCRRIVWEVGRPHDSLDLSLAA